jgi:IS30 family transposase
LEEREKLYAWKMTGLSLREMGRRLGRSHTSLSREVKRNTRFGRPYIPCKAQNKAEKIGLIQRYKAPLKGPQIFLYVREHLRSPYFWTPEMISGRIGIDIKGASISIETIYEYIYSRKARRYKLWELLPCGRRKRMKKHGRKVQKISKIPNAVSIDKRSKIVANRRQVGHWETDNIEGPRQSRPALSNTMERVMRYVKLSKVLNKTADEKLRAIESKMKNLPTEIRLSITGDNGCENSKHDLIAKLFGEKMYFCHPYHSWEKGAVENRNRIVRRFFPKGTDFSKVTNTQIQFVEDVINNMPLKCLKYRTPSEKMHRLMTALKST